MRAKNQQIQHLFDLEFPSYKSAMAGLVGGGENAGRLRRYVNKAESCLNEITALFDANKEEFEARVKAAERKAALKSIGTLYTIQQCAELIANEMFPEDGYEETKSLRLKYRDLCEDCILLSLREGSLRYVNVRTLADFDSARFSDSFFPLDGRVRASDLKLWNRPKVSESTTATAHVMSPLTAESDTPISDETRQVISKYTSAPSVDQNTEPFPGETIEPAPPAAPRARLKPRGGDSLTPMIWEICYDMMDAGQVIMPRYVMAELRARAEKRIWPLVGEVQGGVKFEFERGKESEIDGDTLRKRIKEWKDAITGD